MSEPDFWGSEYWIVGNRIDAYNEREVREWQRISFLASYVVAPYAKKGQKTGPKDIAPWAWGEAKEENKPLTPEQQQRFAKIDAAMKRKHAKRNGKE